MSGATSRSISPSRSARVDSGTPVVRTTRERMTPPWPRAARRGTTSCSSSLRISRGHAGQHDRQPGRGPRARVPAPSPTDWAAPSAPRGTSAWLRLLAPASGRAGRTARPGPPRSASSNSSGVPKSSATTVLLMSSRVGPSPPVVSTAPVRTSASRTASRMASGSSPHAGAAHDAHADRRERARDFGAVGVDGEAEQQLGADGDELEVHRPTAHRGPVGRRARGCGTGRGRRNRP